MHFCTFFEWNEGLCIYENLTLRNILIIGIHALVLYQHTQKSLFFNAPKSTEVIKISWACIYQLKYLSWIYQCINIHWSMQKEISFYIMAKYDFPLVEGCYMSITKDKAFKEFLW